MTSATRSVRSPAARASHSPSSSPLPWGSAPTSRCSASSTRSCSGRPCTSATSTAWSTSACGPIPTTSICATRRARSAASPGGGLPRARTRSPTVTASCPCNKCSRQHRSFRCPVCNLRAVASTPLPRLAPGVTIPQAQAEAEVVYRRGNPSAAASPVPSWQIAMLGGQPADVHPVMELRRELATGSIPITLWLAGVATAVLLIACANGGGLLLARGVRNRREIAVRAALGASRVQLFGELFLETGILALAGGVLGFLASRWADGLIRRFILTDLAAVASPLDARLVGLAIGVTTVSALVSGVWPAVRVVRGNLTQEIANAARSVSAPHARARRLLLASQLALAMVLVVGAALYTTSLWNARALNLGTSLDSVLVSDLDLAGARYTPERAHALIDPITDRLLAIPGVRAVGLSDAGMRPGFITYGYSVPGRDSLPHVANFSAVTPGFFETLGTPIVLGRRFAPADRSARVIIVSASFARRYWPGDAPIGKCVKVGDGKSPCLQVIGVSHDRHTAPGDTTTLYEAFVPLGSPGEPAGLAKLYPLTSVALRVDRDRGRVAQDAQQALQEILPDAPSIRVRPAMSLFDRTLRAWRLGTTLFIVFGAIAVTLALFGVYSVLAYLIAQRGRELAIRIAVRSEERRVGNE